MRLNANGLACARGGHTVFAGVEFAITSGQAMVVTGPNGAGKTTLLRLLAGFLRPSAGELVLTGGDSDVSLAEQAHYVGHQDALKPALTVSENLDFWARFLGGSPGSADELSQLGLAELRQLPAAYLSAGQRRRLSLCRLLAVSRPVWLLDEPTTALDARAVQTLGTLMRDHLDGGGIIVAATHGPLPVDAAIELKIGSRQ
ncbi:MAG: heme ABC exporter ATP-binding protein CcmA [Xanthobacteraceae bacterium]